ncbi:MAG: hypothetical protein AB1589_36485 [Cyanobacteriota bacterium]
MNKIQICRVLVQRGLTLEQAWKQVRQYEDAGKLDILSQLLFSPYQIHLENCLKL